MSKTSEDRTLPLMEIRRLRILVKAWRCDNARGDANQMNRDRMDRPRLA